MEAQNTRVGILNRPLVRYGHVQRIPEERLSRKVIEMVSHWLEKEKASKEELVQRNNRGNAEAEYSRGSVNGQGEWKMVIGRRNLL